MMSANTCDKTIQWNILANSYGNISVVDRTLGRWGSEKLNIYIYIYIQGVLLPNRQTLRGDSTHEDKH